MGIEFRDSRYKRDVSFGKRTVKDGEAVAVWNRLGTHQQVVGPRLVRLFFSTIVFLDKMTAGPKEYLVITNVDGTVEHVRGPTTMFQNPVFHLRVEIKPAYQLTSASECIVINREVRQNFTNEKTGAIIENSRIDRQVIFGPNLFFPAVGDTVVTFKWSGRPTANSPRDCSISYGVDCFSVLTTSMRQWKVDLPLQLTTACRPDSSGVLAAVRGTVLMTICFTIAEVTMLLDNTTDLIGDMYDAMVVDMTALGASREAEKVNAKNLHNIIGLFASLSETFPRLCERAATMGVTLHGFAYRGFEPCSGLAKYLTEMSDIDARIYRERMHAEQEEKRIEADLAARQSRLEHEQNLQEAQLAADMKRLAAEKAYRDAVSEHALQEKQAAEEIDMKRMREVNDEALRVLSSLNELGVDLTTLLTHKPIVQGVDTCDGMVGGLPLVTKVPALDDVFMTAPKSAEGGEAKSTSNRVVKRKL